MDLIMINVGCWLGRLVVDCTLCEWQHPAVDSTEAQESRALVEIIERAQHHVAEAHTRGAVDPRVVDRTLTIDENLAAHAEVLHAEQEREAARGDEVGEHVNCEHDPRGRDMTNAMICAPRLVARPVFSGDAGPQDTPPCFSLPPADPQRFSQGGHDA
jgi:hypothetical protein